MSEQKNVVMILAIVNVMGMRFSRQQWKKQSKNYVQRLKHKEKARNHGSLNNIENTQRGQA